MKRVTTDTLLQAVSALFDAIIVGLLVYFLDRDMDAGSVQLVALDAAVLGWLLSHHFHLFLARLAIKKIGGAA